MTLGGFISNAPSYDDRGRAICNGLPTVWQKSTRIVNTEDDQEYLSDGTQWISQGPANPTVETVYQPSEAICPSCSTSAVIPTDDYVCVECRARL